MRGKLPALALAVLMIATHAQSGSGVAVPAWSAPVTSPSGGCLQARLGLQRTSVVNGTPIITATLFLRNCTDVINPIAVAWPAAHMTFRIVDAAGNDARDDPPGRPSYTGVGLRSGPDLVVPMSAELSFPISSHGAGIGADYAGLLQFGPDDVFVFRSREREVFLRAALEIPDNGKREDVHAWYGRIVLPDVRIPLKPERVDPASVTAQLAELASQLSGSDERRILSALDALSLIDDDRVVPLCLKMVESRLYSVKFRALDVLARRKGDAALSGIRSALRTQGTDLDNAGDAKIATQLAANIRHAAAQALTHSPHQNALALLRSMSTDPDVGVRITVVHAMATDASPESRKVLEALTGDPDPRVRDEALRYLKR